MRERLSAIGGTLGVWSQPRQGTRLEAVVPLVTHTSVSDRP
jgi:signal transduction histidine kinase